MGNKIRQFCYLVWKNYLIQKRKVFVTILELALPALFSLLLIFIRKKVDAHPIANVTSWDPFTVHKLPLFWCDPNSFFYTKWKLYYAPDNDVAKNTMLSVKDELGKCIEDVIAFPTEDKMIAKFSKELESEVVNGTKCHTLAGISFLSLPNTTSNTHQNVTYKIRLSSYPRGDGVTSFNPLKPNENWHTDLMFPLMQSVGPRENDTQYGGIPGYYKEGFLTLQAQVDMALIKLLGNSPDVKYDNVRLKRQPYPPYYDDQFTEVLQKFLGELIMLSFVFSALHIVKEIVHEKERKLKESMKVMGLNNYLHWVAWFLKHFLFLLISVGMMTAFYCIPVSQAGAVVGYTDPSVLFVFLIVYSISVISFCFMISVFFSKANAGAAAGGIVFFVSYLPFTLIQPRYQGLTLSAKLATCLISNVAVSYGGLVIGLYEGIGAGVQWSNIHKPATVDDNFSMLLIMMMLVVDSFIYCVIAWYVEAVFPGQYGLPRPWYFPVQRSYWCGTKAKNEVEDERTPLLSSSTLASSAFFEADPRGIKPGIQIKGLRKEFGKGIKHKVAVKDMKLNMFEGQITALLGHNGAGKTTTMSMITGFIPPTKGTAVVNGYDILADIGSVRDSLGLCPQHDVLFDTLTVEEHLRFFCQIKDYPSELVDAEVERMLVILNLSNKRNAQAKTLSGGMKRKLSVGIALIGGSKIVILDEPTSGMDPNARRQMWDILQNHRETRTILLTTHFMDEADVLGDRIAIMADGEIQCCGTPLFLKNKYGAGYHMVIVKEDSCDTETIADLIMKHVPDATLESDISRELSFILPHESKDRFEKLFTELEQKKDELGISSYGASITTMEEVFIRVGESADLTIRDKLARLYNSETESQMDDDASTASGSATPDINRRTRCPSRGSTRSLSTSLSSYRAVSKNGGISLLFQQFWAMFVKRMLHTFRNAIVTITQLVIPLFFTLIALIVIKTMPKPSNSPPLNLNLSHFGESFVLHNNAAKNDSLAQSFDEFYASQFDKFPGVTTQKVNITNDITNLFDQLSAVANTSLAKYNTDYLISAETNNSVNNNPNVTGYFNNQAFHTPGMTLNALSNAIMGYSTNGTISISTINHPLPRIKIQQTTEDSIMDGIEGFALSFNILFGISFLCSSFVLFVIKERSSKSKHSQFVSGVNSFTFWMSTYCWDLLNFMIPCVLLMVLFAAFNVEAFVGGPRSLYILLLFGLFAWAVLPFMYILSFIFSVPSTGFVWLSMFNILSGIATVMAVEITQLPMLDLQNVSRILEWVFYPLFPNFCLGQGLEIFYQNHLLLNVCTSTEIQFLCEMGVVTPCCKGNCGDFCLPYNENYLAWGEGGIGRMLVFLIIQGYVYFAILFVIESGVLKTLYYVVRKETKPSILTDSVVNEDSDVAAERLRIANQPLAFLSGSDKLVMKELTKYYGNLLAVDRLSVGIPQGECFGLLGINGAGKTSTFKMLTGDEMVTSGEAHLDTFDVKTDMGMVRKRIGYCSQFDALIGELTGRETLTMYARLRGVQEADIPSLVQEVITDLMFEEHSDKMVKDYSGGNQRKLSTAVALIGDPPILFLDEPSTGMDPVARRMLWETLSRARKRGKTLILTSHSMEECEALCTRIAIMVNGQLKCLGSPQHLKNKFGEGYTLIARIKCLPHEKEPVVEPFHNFIMETFPGSILKDVHQGMLHIHITDKTVSWARLFGVVESVKDKFHLDDYSVSQTTLEQVFINFARSQVAPNEPSGRCCNNCWLSCTCCCACCGCGPDDEELQTIVETGSNSSINC